MSEKTLNEIAQEALLEIENSEDTVVIITQEKEPFGGALHMTKKIIKSEKLGLEVSVERIYDFENPIKNDKDEVVAFRVKETKLTLIK